MQAWYTAHKYTLKIDMIGNILQVYTYYSGGARIKIQGGTRSRGIRNEDILGTVIIDNILTVTTLLFFTTLTMGRGKYHVSCGAVTALFLKVTNPRLKP